MTSKIFCSPTTTIAALTCFAVMMPASIFAQAQRKPVKTAVKPVEAPQNTAVANAGPAPLRFVEQMPEFKNGGLADWLAGNLHYPDSSRVHNREGKSVVEFIVSESGSISNARVIRSAGDPLLDEEALRAVRMMPDWKPGKQQGVPVPVIFTLPVTFKLED